VNPKSTQQESKLSTPKPVTDLHGNAPGAASSATGSGAETVEAVIDVVRGRLTHQEANALGRAVCQYRRHVLRLVAAEGDDWSRSEFDAFVDYIRDFAQ
jgi:hypothetical protein